MENEEEGGNEILAKIQYSLIHTQIVAKPKAPQNSLWKGLVILGVITREFFNKEEHLSIKMMMRRITMATSCGNEILAENIDRYIPIRLASQTRPKIYFLQGHRWSLELLRWTSLSRKASCKWLQPEQLPVSFLPTGQSISPYSPATTLWEDKMSQKRKSPEPVSWESRWCCGKKDLYILRWKVSSDSPRTHKTQK